MIFLLIYLRFLFFLACSLGNPINKQFTIPTLPITLTIPTIPSISVPTITIPTITSITVPTITVPTLPTSLVTKPFNSNFPTLTYPGVLN